VGFIERGSMCAVLLMKHISSSILICVDWGASKSSKSLTDLAIRNQTYSIQWFTRWKFA